MKKPQHPREGVCLLSQADAAVTVKIENREGNRTCKMAEFLFFIERVPGRARHDFVRRDNGDLWEFGSWEAAEDYRESKTIVDLSRIVRIAVADLEWMSVQGHVRHPREA